MKKLLSIILLCTSLQINAQDEAQASADPNERAKITQSLEALKVAFMTKELNLSIEEAQKFWPVYNGYTTDIKNARVEFKQDDISFEEKKVVIMKKYRDDFKKVLNSDDRVKKCFRVEPEFHKLLKKEWMRRQSIKMQQRPQMGSRNPNAPMHPNHSGPSGGGKVKP